MEKFANLRRITEDHLKGNLTKLKMEYCDDIKTRVDVVYEDDSQYRFDYIVEIDNHTKQMKFVEHYCTYQNAQIPLKSNKPFEQKLSEYLFKD